MAAKKQSEIIQGTEKEFLDVFKQLCYSRSSWEVWADLISAIACFISTAVDRSPKHFERRKKEFEECTKRLGSAEIPAKILEVIVAALETNPEQDFLGRMYMQLELGNHWKGQFFTPYNVCKAMSEIMIGNMSEEIECRGYVSICDPACGAGATLIAAVNTLKHQREDFQHHVLFVGQDVDRVVAQMCYIQLALLGCAGYICVGNTLTNPMVGHELFPEEREGQELWYMPMFMLQIWDGRRRVHMMDMLLRQTIRPVEEKKTGYTFFFDFDEKEIMA